MEDAAELLEETLDEEKAADEKLSELAFGGLNEEAEGEDDEKEEGDAEKPKRASARKK
jgi:ferritin-like metal-binding protein YciE